MADEAEKWCSRYFKNDTQRALLVLAGRPGTGKTRCAKAVLRWMRHIGPAAFSASKAWPRSPMSSMMLWPAIADAIAIGEVGSIEEAFEDDGLILDDVGAENDRFRQSADKLCQILSRREYKFTLLTTNFEQKDWALKFEARVVDRLMRNSVVVNLDKVPSFALST